MRNLVPLVIQVYVVGVGNDIQFFRLVCLLVGIFAEIARVRILSCYKQQRSRRYFLNLSKRIEIGQCRHTRIARALVAGMLSTFGIAVIAEKFFLYGIGIFPEAVRACRNGYGTPHPPPRANAGLQPLQTWLFAVHRSWRRPDHYGWHVPYHIANARIRGSIEAAQTEKPPLPQIPITPIRSRSTNGCMPSQSTEALKSSTKTSGDTVWRGVPPLSP